MKLSILICHLDSRAASLAKLLAVLQPQIDAAMDGVEVLVESDSGKMSIGEKRNILLDRAKGDYVAHVDDDDLVDQKYCEKIIAAIDEKPDVDCISIEGLVYNTTPPQPFTCSLRYTEARFLRGMSYSKINHLCPTRENLSRRVRFPLISRGEDLIRSAQLIPLLKTESHVCGPLYHYHPHKRPY